jgi:hypothetical protein
MARSKQFRVTAPGEQISARSFLIAFIRRNWGRGLLFSFATGLFFCYFLIVSSKEFHICWPTIDGRLVSAFFRFMNPLRFFETENLFKGSSDRPFLMLQPISYAIDFVARIFIAYGYYQTIQAFRRYGRKS